MKLKGKKDSNKNKNHREYVKKELFPKRNGETKRKRFKHKEKTAVQGESTEHVSVKRRFKGKNPFVWVKETIRSRKSKKSAKTGKSGGRFKLKDKFKLSDKLKLRDKFRLKRHSASKRKIKSGRVSKLLNRIRQSKLYHKVETFLQKYLHIKLPNRKSSARKKGNALFGIRNKIFICFIVPVVFMVVLGYTSYKKAADGMYEAFDDATQQTINMASEYVDVSNSFIEAEALKYVIDEDLGNYFKGKYQDNAAERRVLMDTQRAELVASQFANAFISNIFLIPDGDVQMITTYEKNQPGNYQEYMEEMLALSEDGKNIPTWVDEHKALDEYMEIPDDEYILSCQMTARKGNAVIVVDVKRSVIEEFLQKLDLGEGSIIGFVTPNGREVITRADEKKEEADSNEVKAAELETEEEIEAAQSVQKVFADKDFYLNRGEQDGSKQVKIDGEKYLFFHTTSEKTGSAVCALVPMEVVNGKADAIKSLSVFGILIASVIATLIGVYIAAGIRKNMQSISGGLKEVAGGDLTTTVSVKGRDEFVGFATAANDMIANNKKLVRKVSQATSTLEESANEVAEVSGVIHQYSENITTAIEEINEGMEKQSVHAQECVTKTDTLSAEIQEVNRSAHSVEVLVESAEQMISRGMELVQILEQRANQTTIITSTVEQSVENLKNESKIINQFVSMITDISDETNLLSLNASIEAARAGDAGKGFAVVAEEIRKLADSSAEAAREIQHNVENITAQTEISVNDAKQAGMMVALQTEAVQEVTAIFRSINEEMESLFTCLKDILVSTERADREREYTLEAVINISKIIEETASSAEVVANVATNLQKNVESLNSTADVLGENMNGLMNEISVFKID